MADDYGYDASQDYGYGDDAAGGDYGYGDSAGADYGYGDAAAGDYGYGDDAAAGGADYGYGDDAGAGGDYGYGDEEKPAKPETPPPQAAAPAKNRPKRRSSVTQFSLEADACGKDLDYDWKGKGGKDKNEAPKK
jgi:hypothetical protein